MIVVCLLAQRVVEASPQSDELIEQGIVALEAQRYDEALQRFIEAEAADSDDAQAPFFRAVALNRLGRHAEALESLGRAQVLDGDHPDMAFESGWALLGAGRYREAIEQLEWFEAAYPGRGQTVEFMGRAHYHLGNYDRAEQLLHDAISRDPDVVPTARTYLALISRRRGDEPAAARHIEALVQDAAASPIGDVIGRYTRHGASPYDTLIGTPSVSPTRQPVHLERADDKPWHITISTGAGYNSNVLAIADGFALPGDISDTESVFGRFTFSAAYDLIRDDANRLTARYAFGTNIYEEDLDEADLMDHYLSVSYHRQLAEYFTASVRISDQYTVLGGNSFRNRFAVRAALARRMTPWLAGDISYTFAANDYMFDTTSTVDRDGESHTISLTGYWLVPNTRLHGRFGYFFSTNATDGTDFDFDAHGLFIEIRHPLPLGIDAEVIYSHIFEDYDNLNSFTTPAPFAVRREDDVDIVTVQLSRPFNVDFARRARAYVRYDYTRNDSNVAFFDYDQHVVVVGLILDF